MSISIAMIITYFGKFPNYINFFLETCRYNKNITFIIFSDNAHFNEIGEIDNIKFYPMSIDEFNILGSNKLEANLSIKNGYKLCDLKPMYGKIYEDFIRDYEFWGFCDMDIIFGDISKVLTQDLLSKYDVISAHDRYLSGPFSLFRNNEVTNGLFEVSKDYKKVISEDKVFLFDEASTVIHHLWEGHNIFDFDSEVESMTHVLMNPAKCKEKVAFEGFISEKLNTTLVWNKGKLLDGTKELSVFHFIIYKSKLSFTVPTYDGGDIFYFNDYGFYSNSIKSKTIDRASAFVVNVFAKIRKRLLK